jgi:riboflavin kinase/FMN adenylyltransferase
VRVWRGLDDVTGHEAGDVTSARSVVSVGNFDGVHRGHQTVLAGVVARAAEIGAQAVVTTFDPHPMTVVHPTSAPLRLTELPRRLDLMEYLGVDGVLVLPFTNEVAQWSPEEFVERVLVDALRAAEVHVGQNFRFGHRAAGDVATLEALGAQHGFAVRTVPLAGEGARWSSTYVRQCLDEGDVTAAAAALGRPHRVEGPVVVGDKRGRELGYPTANLALDDGVAIPADGVYAGWLVRADGTRLPAAISIGTNPTFGGTTRRVEAYALDRDDLELYGEHVGIEFAQRLRDTLTFDGVEPLVAQMAVDVDQARAITASA